MIYKPKAGMIAWILHRITGIFIMLYLTAHIFVTKMLTDSPESFNMMMPLIKSPIAKLLEIGLLGVVLYHAFNGIRIVIIDFFEGTRKHEKLFWVISVFLFLVVWGYFAVTMLMHIIH